MAAEIKVLRPGDEAFLENIAPGVFDVEIQRQRASEFLSERICTYIGRDK